MINFAHGEVFMIGAFIALIAILSLFSVSITSVPLALFVALILSMILTAVWGWSIERVAYRPLRSLSGSRRSSPPSACRLRCKISCRWRRARVRNPPSADPRRLYPG